MYVFPVNTRLSTFTLDCHERSNLRPVALSREKFLLCPLNRMLGGSRCFERLTNLLPLYVNLFRYLSLSTQNLVATPTEVFRLVLIGSQILFINTSITFYLSTCYVPCTTQTKDIWSRNKLSCSFSETKQ
jgi:hypothetical protein